MKQYRSRITPNFLRMYRALPPKCANAPGAPIAASAKIPTCRGCVSSESGRIGESTRFAFDARYRAVGEMLGDEITWAFIGDHEAYARYLAGL